VGVRQVRVPVPYTLRLWLGYSFIKFFTLSPCSSSSHGLMCRHGLASVAQWSNAEMQTEPTLLATRRAKIQSQPEPGRVVFSRLGLAGMLWDWILQQAITLWFSGAWACNRFQLQDNRWRLLTMWATSLIHTVLHCLACSIQCYSS